jgi:hypothetical protein
MILVAGAGAARAEVAATSTGAAATRIMIMRASKRDFIWFSSLLKPQKNVIRL